MFRVPRILLALLFVAYWVVSLAAAEQPARLRVLTFNIHHGRGADGQIDLARIARTVRAASPDLVALQEVDRNTSRSGGQDQLKQLAKLPDQLVDTIVTSPPYFQQRNYVSSKQIGREQTPEQYVERLVSVFSQCRRVLRESGSFWLVIGDKYLQGELLGMPWRVALALKEEGWILRSDVIWHKPNATRVVVCRQPYRNCTTTRR